MRQAATSCAIVLTWLCVYLALGLVLSSCHRNRPDFDEPNHVLPFSERPPADAAEWVRLRNELDNARAENVRKDRALEAANAERSAAYKATWQRFGAYSWFFMLPGVSILALSYLPWTAFLKAARSMAMVLIGLGFICAAMPYVLARYGDFAFIPMALVAGLWVMCIGAMDIRARWKRARSLASVLVDAANPASATDIRDVIEVKKKADPLFRQVLQSAVAAAPPAVAAAVNL